MGARTKLNQISVLGSVAVAAVIGGLAESWTVFLIAAALLIGGSLYVEDVRPTGRHRR